MNYLKSSIKVSALVVVYLIFSFGITFFTLKTNIKDDIAYNRKLLNEEEPALELLSSFYLGGSDFDKGSNIALDSKENIIITGNTNSQDFPITINSHSRNLTGGHDIFIVKYSRNLSILWSTFFWGSSADFDFGLAIDNEDCIIIVGYTLSDSLFVRNAFDATFGGRVDGFVAKFSSNGTLLWSTYIGGSELDVIYGVDVDSSNNVIIVGITESNDINMSNDKDSSFGGNYDGLIAKYSPDGILIWNSYFGNAGYDRVRAVVVDKMDNIILSGDSDSNFLPTESLNQSILDNSTSSYTNCFLLTLNSNGDLLRSTIFGGTNSDYPSNLVVDTQGKIILSGTTLSNYFPTLRNIYGQLLYESVFISKLFTNHTVQ